MHSKEKDIFSEMIYVADLPLSCPTSEAKLMDASQRSSSACAEEKEVIF